MWLSVFFGGIWQFITNIFSWKNKTPFWRVIWSVITICILAFTLMLGYAFYDEFYGRHHRYNYYYSNEYVGDRYYFHNKGKDCGKSYISDRSTGKKIITGLDWIASPEDGDSLIVFAKNKKRGFFNRYTGEVDIPAEYDAAWCFNDGVAGVCVGDSVFFINHDGNPINSRKYLRMPGRNYAYHGNYFAFTENGKKGLVDRKGNVTIPAVYDDISSMDHNLWCVNSEGKYGTVNADGKFIIPCEYKDIFIYPEGGIVVVAEDNSKKKMDYNGVVTDDFVYDYTQLLEYYSEEYDKDGERLQKPADLLIYCSNGHYGLIDKKGKPVTPPIYSSITAYTSDLFECQIDNYGEYLLLNVTGEKVN